MQISWYVKIVLLIAMISIPFVVLLTSATNEPVISTLNLLIEIL